jgi:fructosamine-3-kinase
MRGSGNLTAAASWLQANQSVEITGFAAVGGGCINETGVISLSNGTTLFLKRHPAPPADFFQAEASGLNRLRVATSLRIPQVIHVNREFLLLEDLGKDVARGDFWVRLGEGLAELHSRHFPQFGFEQDNYCGLTPQCNGYTADGFHFFARNRLLELARRTAQAGLLDRRDCDRIERLAESLRQWIPPQPAVLIHGDLWSGNVHCDRDGNPALIDPACYQGWAEAELAMTTLFGGFDRGFYQAYERASGIDPHWRERAPLYNLSHLLNHLLLFGGSYHGQVRGILSRYG